MQDLCVHKCPEIGREFCARAEVIVPEVTLNRTIQTTQSGEKFHHRRRKLPIVLTTGETETMLAFRLWLDSDDNGVKSKHRSLALFAVVPHAHPLPALSKPRRSRRGRLGLDGCVLPVVRKPVQSGGR